jgi:hypothetical protein
MKQAAGITLLIATIAAFGAGYMSLLDPKMALAGACISLGLAGAVATMLYAFFLIDEGWKIRGQGKNNQQIRPNPRP